MAPPRIGIFLDENPRGVYHSGQTLSGSVVLQLDKPERVKNFIVVVYGWAKVEWITHRSIYGCHFYSGEQKLIRAETVLIPPIDGHTEKPIGKHVYSFTTQIPWDAPSSFNAKYGKIEYYVRAILDRPGKIEKSYAHVALKVLRSLNLENYVKLKEPQEGKLTKTFWLWPCASNPLSLEVKIPTLGYVPGQKIPITISLNNTSSTTVQGITSSLKQKVSYISKNKTTLVTPGIRVASVHTLVTRDEPACYLQELQIPLVIPTDKCLVMTIDYVLKVEVDAGKCHRKPKIDLPITIGTFPFAPSPVTSAATPNDLKLNVENSPSEPVQALSPQVSHLSANAEQEAVHNA